MRVTQKSNRYRSSLCAIALCFKNPRFQILKQGLHISLGTFASLLYICVLFTLVRSVDKLHICKSSHSLWQNYLFYEPPIDHKTAELDRKIDFPLFFQSSEKIAHATTVLSL